MQSNCVTLFLRKLKVCQENFYIFEIYSTATFFKKLITLMVIQVGPNLFERNIRNENGIIHYTSCRHGFSGEGGGAF